MKFGNIAQEAVDNKLKQINRPVAFEFYSEDVNEYTLLNKIDNGRKNAPSYVVFIAFMLARSNRELAALKDIAQKIVRETQDSGGYSCQSACFDKLRKVSFMH